MALDFLAGCLGGCAGILAGHPFDTVKVHLQTQDFRNPKFRGTFHCFQSIIQKENVSGLYRGISSPLAAVSLINAIVFGVYGNTQRRLADPDCLTSHMVAGATAGLVQSFVCCPMELGKTRAQLRGGSPLRCLVSVARSHGPRGVFRGLGVTLLRELPGYGVYFAAYEAMTRGSSDLGTGRMMLAGGMSGVISWLVSFPMDVVKSRLQADLVGKYSGGWDCLVQSVSREGLSVLTRGLASTMLRAFATSAATFTVVTWVLRLSRDAPQDVAAPTYHTPLRGGEFVTLGAAGLEVHPLGDVRHRVSSWCSFLKVTPRRYQDRPASHVASRESRLVEGHIRSMLLEQHICLEEPFCSCCLSLDQGCCCGCLDTRTS